MNVGPPRRRRARAVADAPVVELLGRADDLAKGWLLALIEEAPLEEMPAILSSELVRDGPRLCAAVVRALADDTDLDRLRSGAALEPLAASAAELAGADGPAAAARAIDALSGVIWSAVRAELSDPGADQVAELAERLGVVIEQVRIAVLRRLEGGEAPAATPASEPPSRVADPLEVADPVEAAMEPPMPSERPPLAALAPEPPPRDVDTSPLWIGAFEDEIDRSLRSGAPLSLLLAELHDADQMVAVEGDAGAEPLFGRFTQSVRSAVRRQDTLACETDTRAWIIARDTGRPGAQALAQRVADAVHQSPGWRGAPLGVTVGLAVLGEDGHNSTDLIEAAEEARFLAEASGITVARADESVGDPDPAAS